MSDLYTVVRPPGNNFGGGYACRGRTSRDDAVAEARRHFQRQYDQAAAFLRLSDADLLVTVVRGLHREKLVEVLEPEGWIIVNSKSARIGPSYMSKDEALAVLDGYRKDKRDGWKPYRIVELGRKA
ncbi:hypothetical protein CPT_Sonora_081 [Stenotrophomonas phage Sonora]|nr:hypothetical protein CPT_Sonora_081 [Stenotrophomonas phage Sonora]